MGLIHDALSGRGGQTLTITINRNGTFIPANGYDGFSKVTVDVPKELNLQDIEITQNGTYLPEEGYDGFNSVTVDVESGGGGGGGGGGGFNVNVDSADFGSILALPILGERYTDDKYAFELHWGYLGGIYLSIADTYGQDKASWYIRKPVFSVCYKNGLPMWAQDAGSFFDIGKRFDGSEWRTETFKDNAEIVKFGKTYPITNQNGFASYPTIIYNYYEREPPLIYEENRSLHSAKFVKTPDLDCKIYTDLSAEELVECYYELLNKYGG